MKANHYLIPLGIISVIVAIWAALRKPGSNPTVILQSSPSLQPSVTPLGAPAIDLSATPAPAPNVQTQAPSAAASGVPSYTSQDLSGGGMIAAPKPAQSSPSFYGPVRDFINSMMPQMDTAPAPAKSGCGCGGGGACGTSCVSPCAGNNSRFPDGRGGCLAFNRKTQIAAISKDKPTLFMDAVNNLKSSDTNMFDIFQQTVFDNEMARGGVPASPFLSPV